MARNLKVGDIVIIIRTPNNLPSRKYLLGQIGTIEGIISDRGTLHYKLRTPDEVWWYEEGSVLEATPVQRMKYRLLGQI